MKPNLELTDEILTAWKQLHSLSIANGYVYAIYGGSYPDNSWFMLLFDPKHVNYHQTAQLPNLKDVMQEAIDEIRKQENN